MTYGEIVYMCLDEIKAMSDDAYVTEDHIVFLMSKYRSYLLRQKYDKTNMPVAQSNYQTVEVDKQIPLYIMEIAKPQILAHIIDPDSQIPQSKEFAYIPYKRYKYTGDNKYTSSLNRATITPEGAVKTSVGNQTITVTAVLDDMLSYGYTMEERCPIEDDLVAGVIELVVKDILGIAYRPEDKINNGSDDLSTVGMTTKNSK